MNQECNAVWNNRKYENFKVKNGVRQGSVISAILFAVYINELLVILRQSELGCHVDGLFMGAQIFADDIFLLSGNISGLQAMINICADFASKKNLKFGTNKVPEKSKKNALFFQENKRITECQGT